MFAISSIGLISRLRQTAQQLQPAELITSRNRNARAGNERASVNRVQLRPLSHERIGEAFDAAPADKAVELEALAEAHRQLRLTSRRGSPRIAIKIKGRILFVSLADIIAIEAQGNNVVVRRQSGSDLLRASISVIAENLRPYGFVRIHRSVLVNSACVEEVRPCSTGEYTIRIKGEKQSTVTRTYKKNLSELAEFGIV